MLVATPWYLGSAPWQAQYYLSWGTLALLIAIAGYVLFAFLAKERLPLPPLPSWILMGLALLAWGQSIRSYGLEQDDSSVPPSVEMQRWALGVTSPPEAIQETAIHVASFTPNILPCDIASIERPLLARSLDPLHTRGGMGCLVLAAALCWSGAACFSMRRPQVLLLVSMTIMGIAVAGFGLQGAFSYRETNILGLATGQSFASFYSKNAAAAYLNVCIAGAIGLFTWTLFNLKRKKLDVRYRVSEENSFLKAKGAIEDFFADLNTPQIASLLCVIFLIVTLLISQCRGAVVGAVVGIVCAAVIANYKSRGRGGAVVTVLTVLIAIGAMTAFQVDENAYSRLETLTDFDLKADAINGRLYIWQIAIQTMSYYGLLGSGLGTFQYAYLPFQDPSSPGWFYRAESLFLQCGVDLGIVGLAAFVGGVLICFAKLQRRLPSDTWKLGYSAKFAGSYLLISQCVHGSVDHGLMNPAGFIPAALLWGGVVGYLDRVRSESQKFVDRRETQASLTAKRHPVPGFVCGVALCSAGMGAWVLAEPALKNLAAGEVLDNWVRNERKLPLEEREPNRVETLLKLWSLDTESMLSNQTALRLLADAGLYEFRREQLAQAPGSTNWTVAWPNTDPLLLQIGLDRAKNDREQEALLRLAGGKVAIDLLEQSATFYARGQLLAPLDWRLSWGRCLSTLHCSRDDMARLISSVDRLGRHSPNQMINSALLFRNQLEDEDLDKIWKQSMRAKPSSAIATAKNLVAERTPDQISIDIFPQRSDILISLAYQVFTKAEFPDLYRQLWERARDKFDGSTLTPGQREVWQADAALALEEFDKEIEHLKSARRFLPSDINLGIRLAYAFRQKGDLEGAQSIVNELLPLDPQNPTLQRLRRELVTASLSR